MKKQIKIGITLMLVVSLIFNAYGIISYAESGGATGSEWQIMPTGNFGAGEKSKGVNTLINNADIETISDGKKVIVAKSISSTNTENYFDITLKVKTDEEIIGEVTSPNTATVLVIDSSSSMTRNKDSHDSTKTRYIAAQEAAYEFLDSMYKDAQEDGGHRWVRLIDYNYNVTDAGTWHDVATKSGLSNAKDDIANIKCATGTNVYGGIKQANKIMGEIEVNSGEGTAYGIIDNYFAVVMTDGQSNSLNYEDVALPAHGSRNPFVINNSELKTVYTETLKAGKEFTSASSKRKIYGIIYDEASTQIYRENGKSYTVETLFEAFTNQYFTTGEKIDISTSFGRVSTVMKIMTKAWTVIDPMGENIEFIQFNPKGSANVGSNVAACTNETIIWHLLADDPDSTPTSADPYYTYSLSYKVKLDTTADDFIDDYYYPTNGYTYLDYVFMDEDGYFYDEDGNKLKDQNDVSIYEIPFTVPGVMGEAYVEPEEPPIEPPAPPVEKEPQFAVIYHDGDEFVSTGYSEETNYTVATVTEVGFEHEGLTFEGWALEKPTTTTNGAVNTDFTSGNKIVLTDDENDLIVFSTTNAAIAYIKDNCENYDDIDHYHLDLYAVWSEEEEPEPPIIPDPPEEPEPEEPEEPVEPPVEPDPEPPIKPRKPHKDPDSEPPVEPEPTVEPEPMVEPDPVVEEPPVKRIPQPGDPDYEDIFGDDIPLGYMEGEEEYEVGDLEPPLATIPATGDNSPLVFYIMILSGILLVLILVFKNKKIKVK